MIVLTRHDLDNLRLLADKTALEGGTDDAALLNALLDRVEEYEEALESAGEFDSISEMADRVEELHEAVDGLDTKLHALRRDLRSKTPPDHEATLECVEEMFAITQEVLGS